ncbi:MAG: tRNA (adenosine(37)-N6)-threonylcarbamoyltransferase complex ATPase subunit type 1 TsaE [Gammaproteobacteria bacterium]|nr:tRNA (adenosine(37)-N6)-threonylcarbamoyltransferase complex ATPase subunit type 1 TsaE [Gammaproteobacteria bacterium]
MNEAGTRAIDCPDEAATLRLGECLARAIEPPFIIFLQGDLGAGKTTLARGLIRTLGVQGAIKSPTFTLVEPYQTARFAVYHFDLYRVADPQELELAGLRDYLAENALILIEWPERAAGLNLVPDMQLSLAPSAVDGRSVEIATSTPAGAAVLARLAPCLTQHQALDRSGKLT